MVCSILSVPLYSKKAASCYEMRQLWNPTCRFVCSYWPHSAAPSPGQVYLGILKCAQSICKQERKNIKLLGSSCRILVGGMVASSPIQFRKWHNKGWSFSKCLSPCPPSYSVQQENTKKVRDADTHLGCFGRKWSSYSSDCCWTVFRHCKVLHKVSSPG